MSEKPILFSAPMVRAILDGRKTMTRRVVKPQPTVCPLNPIYVDWKDSTYSDDDALARCCPYGAVGDRLWVREDWVPVEEIVACTEDEEDEPGSGVYMEYGIDYPADGFQSVTQNLDAYLAWERRQLAKRGPQVGRVQQAMFMPRWASRITLEITEVRVERLQDITLDDIFNEGVQFEAEGDAPTMGLAHFLQINNDRIKAQFGELWDSLNGKKPGYSWEANPWVWAISFRRVLDPTIRWTFDVPGHHGVLWTAGE